MMNKKKMENSIRKFKLKLIIKYSNFDTKKL